MTDDQNEQAIAWARVLPRQLDPDDFCGLICLHPEHDGCPGFPGVIHLKNELAS